MNYLLRADIGLICLQKIVYTLRRNPNHRENVINKFVRLTKKVLSITKDFVGNKKTVFDSFVYQVYNV